MFNLNQLIRNQKMISFTRRMSSYKFVNQRFMNNEIKPRILITGKDKR